MVMRITDEMKLSFIKIARVYFINDTIELSLIYK